MNGQVMTFGALGLAIVCEVIGTTFMQRSEQFSRLVPSLLTLVFYAAAFYLLSLTLRTVPVGIAYAIWSGLGIVLISAIGYFVLRQPLDTPALIGLGCIILGVAIINLFSNASPH